MMTSRQANGLVVQVLMPGVISQRYLYNGERLQWQDIAGVMRPGL